MSEDLGKPVVAHCVRAHGELVQLRHRLQPRRPWIVHGFARSRAVATECIQAGLYLSFGAAIITNPAARYTAENVPLDRVLLETDDSVRTIADVYAAFAEIRRMDTEAVERVVLENARRVFGDFVG
jgi:TatD DNase family protein